MNILVINPPNIPHTPKELLIEPIDLIQLGSFIENLGHNVAFLDMDIKRMETNNLEGYLCNDFTPDLVIIAYDYHIPLHTKDALNNISSICALLKRHSIVSILIGKAVTYAPKIIEELNVDIGIVGEPEIPIRDLLTKDITKIKGIIKSEERIELDELPIPNRKLADIGEYIDVRSMLTSRGCVNNCDFCPIPGYWGKWRCKSADRVYWEIEYLTQVFGAKKIIFLDDNATVDKNRMKEISKRIIEDKYINARFGCLSSINCYDKETFELMYNAGFRWVHFGIESGSKRVREMNGKHFETDYAKQVIKECKEIGYRVRTSFILDLPGTTREDMVETFNFIYDTEPDEIRAHFLSLRLGTKIGNKLLEEGVTPTHYIHSDRPLIESKEYSKEDLMKDLDFLENILIYKDYKIVKNADEWKNLERLRNKNGKIKFLALCPAKYGIDWEL